MPYILNHLFPGKYSSASPRSPKCSKRWKFGPSSPPCLFAGTGNRHSYSLPSNEEEEEEEEEPSFTLWTEKRLKYSTLGGK